MAQKHLCCVVNYPTFLDDSDTASFLLFPVLVLFVLVLVLPAVGSV